MKNRLKNLYKYLIENRKHEFKSWHDAYSEFYGQVRQIRERIKAGESLSQSDSDVAFLQQLLYEKNNGIASRGQSTLSESDFNKVIHDHDFIKYLEKLIIEPNAENYINFSKIWPQKVTQNNPVLVNRVAAACTLEVSTTVDSGKFNQVFSWLIHEGIIPAYPAEEDQDWYSKNIFLLKIIKDEFSD
ncbi:MAG: restriction endonuclease, partial [Candidatus Competibacteraceae bacterium]|nr:restriction endonuclease [Candidatus Competibacteraceae bacterium]